MKTTFVERANSNAEVYRKAIEQLGSGREIKPLSQIYLERKQQFFMKVVRAEAKDPTRAIVFLGGSMKTRTHLPRRVGRPKAKWAREEAKKIWETLQKGRIPAVFYDESSLAQGEAIRDFANQYKRKR